MRRNAALSTVQASLSAACGCLHIFGVLGGLAEIEHLTFRSASDSIGNCMDDFFLIGNIKLGVEAGRPSYPPTRLDLADDYFHLDACAVHQEMQTRRGRYPP